MKALIRYRVNGKEYVEEVIDVVIYNKKNEQIIYAFSTIDDDVCVIEGFLHKGGKIIYPMETP